MSVSRQTKGKLQGVCGLADAELFELEESDMPLAPSARLGLKEKFSLSAQEALLLRISDWLHDGAFYRGSWQEGEIEIVALKRIYTHRFWTEVQVWVLMPPTKGTKEPVRAAFAGIIPGPGIYPGAAVLGIPDPDHIVIVEMYRFHGLFMETLNGRGKGWRWELPRGAKKPNETHEEAAVRELGEEVGVAPTDQSSLIPLGVVEPDSGQLISAVHLYALTGVNVDTALVNLDVTEAPTATRLLPVDEVLEAVFSGKITCGISSTLLFRALGRGIIRSQRLPLTLP